MKKIGLIVLLILLSAGAILYFGVWIAATKILLFPVIRGMYRSVFPSQAAIVQMAPFHPTQITLPDSLYPIRIDPTERADRFTIYATNGNAETTQTKWLILMRDDGTILYSLQIPTECQKPYAAEGGMIIGPYCYQRESALFTVTDNKIEETAKFESARLDAGIFERIVFSQIDDDGTPSQIAQGVTYSHVCEDHKGSCYYKNATLSIDDTTVKLDGWYLTDYLPLKEREIYLILSRNNTSKPDQNSLLKISY